MIDFGLGVALKPLEFSYDFQKWRNDPKIWRWTRQNDLISENHHRDWFDAQAKDPSIKMYAITEPRHDSPILGVCGLTSINYLNRNAEFSLYIAPGKQKSGYGRPALLTLLFHGFKNMNLHLIWGETFENNHAQRVFSEIGMVNEGRRRQFYFKDGKYWDAILFSITGPEFLKRHGDRSCF